MDMKPQTARQHLRNISTQAFLNFGLGQVGYIRPVSNQNGQQKGFGIFGADGALIEILPSYKMAVAALYQKDMDYASLQ